MRTTRRSAVGDDAPSLWLVAIVCFGPVTALWLLGAVMAPLWVSMIVVLLSRPEEFSVDWAEALWGSVTALAYVAAGFVGLSGLLRILILPRHERPKRHRFFTLGMVAVGLTALLGFSYPIGLDDLSDAGDLIALIVLVVLPLSGAAWLLVKSWPFLLAGPADARLERGEPRD